MIRKALIPLLLLLSLSSLAESGTSANCIREIIEENVENNKFQVNRELIHYNQIFGPEFAKHLGRLGRNHHWIDMGAGNAFATRQYLRLVTPKKRYFFNGRSVDKLLDRQLISGKAKVTAVTFKTDKPIKSANGFKLMTGRYVENIPTTEIGKADFITDLYGPLLYAKRIDKVLQKYFDLLKKNGTMLVMSNLIDSSTKIDGVPFSKWLENIPGIKVVRSDSFFPHTPDYVQLSVLKITKTSDQVQIPKLKLVGGKVVFSEKYKQTRPFPDRDYVTK